MNKVFRQGIRHGIPIALGYLSVSFAFGMKAVSDGLTVLQAVLISMTNLTSEPEAGRQYGHAAAYDFFLCQHG